MRRFTFARYLAVAVAALLALTSAPAAGAAPSAQNASDPKTLVVGTAFAINDAVLFALGR